jgi:hypothetical protein
VEAPDTEGKSEGTFPVIILESQHISWAGGGNGNDGRPHHVSSSPQETHHLHHDEPAQDQIFARAVNTWSVNSSGNFPRLGIPGQGHPIQLRFAHRTTATLKLPKLASTGQMSITAVMRKLSISFAGFQWARSAA